MELAVDVLMELGNIGSGNAAARLEDWLGEPVAITLTNTFLFTLEDIKRHIVSPCESGLWVHACVTGGVQGHILYMLTREEGRNILDIIIGGEVEGSNLTECEESALSETGNILFGSYFTALHEMLDVEIDISPPRCGDNLVGLIKEGLSADRMREEYLTVIIETMLISQRTLQGSRIIFFTGIEDAPRIVGLAEAR
ncbi:MAG: chemotaxis protein CheC [Actinomycetota bacterium]|nr:chemotaxis protein CheC [Actinomycetota bacterium]